jgi:ubiquinone/menaquinone biosynthesis C-methylase UbiE
MKMGRKLVSIEILPVNRTKAEAKASYDAMSGYYDILSGKFENRFKELAMNQLKVDKGESVLEVGFGTGYCLQKMALSVGENGKVFGIDLSTGMVKKAHKRLEKAGLIDRVELHSGDAAELPFEVEKFDAVFSSFSLELFDTPEIPQVLAEMKRVLKPNGRLGILSMSKEEIPSVMVRLYEWSHKNFPRFADCRPIHVERSIIDAGFKITYSNFVNMMGLPARIVIAINQPNLAK